MKRTSSQRQEDVSMRLRTLSNPRKPTQRFESHPYNEGRFNYNHFDGRLHRKAFCTTVKGLNA